MRMPIRASGLYDVQSQQSVFKKKNEKQESSQNQVSSDEESNKDTAKLTDESISAEDNKEPLKKE